MIKLSKRLSAVAGQVDRCDRLADIGTDHGYLPIFLYENNIINKAFCCDKSKQSLDKASKNILRHGLESDIVTILGDGLKNIGEDDLDAVVIAGMGGMLIISILEASRDLVSSVKQLVLQPQLHIDKVRRFIHTINFKISDEEMVFEDGKYYTVIKCEKGTDEEYDDAEYLVGKKLIDKRSEVLKQFLNHETARIKTLTDIVGDNMRLEELKELLNVYKGVLKCL